jgi:hypothetical protein
MRHTVNRSKVVLEHFDDETILINMQTCVYFSLNPSGCEVWKLVELGHDTAAIATTLAERYAGPGEAILAAVEALTNRLLEEGLIDPTTGPVSRPITEPTLAVHLLPPSPPVGTGRQPFIAPSLSRYDDMQELLLLDPIHEVDDSGWPNARAQPIADVK